MSESTDQFLTEFIQAWNAHDLERVSAFYAEDYEDIDVAQATPQRGRDSMRRKVAYYLRAFPDLCVTLDRYVAQDHQLALFWTWSGTHRGTFMNIPPSGRTVTVRGSSLLEVTDGQVRRGWRVWDLAGLLRDLGLLPEL